MGSGVVHGDGGGGGGGGAWAHAPKAVNALAKTADINKGLFMVRRQGACQHHVSYATGERVPRPQPQQPLACGGQGFLPLGKMQADVAILGLAEEAGSRHSGDAHL